MPLLTESRKRVLVPLVAQGSLVGLLSLGPHASGGAYSHEDLVFLMTLADEAAAAVSVVRFLEDADGRSDKHESRAATDV